MLGWYYEGETKRSDMLTQNYDSTYHVGISSSIIRMVADMMWVEYVHERVWAVVDSQTKHRHAKFYQHL